MKRAAAGCSSSIVNGRLKYCQSLNMARRMQPWLKEMLIMSCHAKQSLMHLQQVVAIKQASGGAGGVEHAHPLMASGMLSISL